MEINSSLINSKSFKLVKDSLIDISKIDHEEDFRVDMLEYINDSADNNDDEFFFDMLEYVRFLNPKSNHVAYTDKYHLIWMNAPNGGEIGKKVRQWDFVYDHECLHQLWDTFGVGDEIKKQGIKYDHDVLNIASDCVINDYLSFYRKKESPKKLITPEYLKDKYGIDYDRRKDTQYTLYLKLLEVADKLKQDENLKEQGGDGRENDNEEKQNQSATDGNVEGNKNQNNKKDKGEGNKGKGGEDDKKGNISKGWNDDAKLSKEDNADGEDVDLNKIKKEAEQIIEKYREKISGDLGKFISQCKYSQKLKESGLVTNTIKSSSGWNTKLNQYVNAYIKNQVFKKQREFKRTYQRVKRGSGFVEYGQPIQRGKKIKDDKLLINVAFYIDISGSMHGCIDDVFKSVYIIANSLQKQFGREKVVDKLSFDMFIFNEHIKKLPWGKKVSANGGNVSFDQIVEYIKNETNTYMINIVITDAEFDINENKTENFIKEINGVFMFVTNNLTSPMKYLAKKQSMINKLYFVPASNNFEID